MAVSNRDRVGQMFETLAPALDAFITQVVGAQLPAGHDWTQLVALKDSKSGVTGKKYSASDPRAAAADADGEHPASGEAGVVSRSTGS